MDQIFSVVASLVARYEFSTPSELIEILDFAGRPDHCQVGEQERKRVKKNFAVDCEAYKLDQTAKWHDWVGAAGVRVKGLRFLTTPTKRGQEDTKKNRANCSAVDPNYFVSF